MPGRWDCTSAFCVSGPALSLADMGRRFAGPARLRHKIKRSHRLLGNRRLQGQARPIYAALCRVTLARIQEPLIQVDWSDLKADQSLHLLRASLTVGWRSLTLYEEVHLQRRLNNRRIHARFLQRLAALLLPHVAPVIVAGAGFKVPFYRAVERLGWRWVGWVRGRDYLRLTTRWVSSKALFKRATPTATTLGELLFGKHDRHRSAMSLNDHGLAPSGVQELAKAGLGVVCGYVLHRMLCKGMLCNGMVCRTMARLGQIRRNRSDP